MAVTYVDVVPGYAGAARRLSRSKRRLLRLVLASLLGIILVQGIGQFSIWMLSDPLYDLGYSVMVHKTTTLKFEVAGHKYQVRSPNVRLTQEEVDAYWYYVTYNHYPVWAADGPMAVDP